MWVQVLIQSLKDWLFFQEAIEPTNQAINWLPHSCPAMIAAAWLTSLQYDLTFIPYFTPFLHIFWAKSPLELISLDSQQEQQHGSGRKDARIDLINWTKVEIRLLWGGFNISTPGETAHFCRPLLVLQGRTYPAANQGGPDAGCVSILWQHQIRHVRDRGVPAVRSGLWLGAVVPIPQPTQGLVGTTQPYGPYTVIQQQKKKHFLKQSVILINPITTLLSFDIKMSYTQNKHWLLWVFQNSLYI